MKSIAAKANEMAMTDDSRSSALTLGPTFSTLLKSIFEFKFSVNFF